MVFPGFVRKLNKSLPALLQALAVICLVHYVMQGLITKVNRYNQRYYSQTPLSPSRPTGNNHGGKVLRRPSTRSHTTRSTTTTTTTTPAPPPPDMFMEEEQTRRLDVLHKACARWSNMNGSNITEEEKAALSLIPKTPLYQALLVSEKHHLSLCPAARTGIQWLSRRLLSLTGKYNELQLLKLPEPASSIARHSYPYLSSWEKYPIVLAKSINILMARHPLDRLLASYRHTLENPERNPNGYLHYGRRIVRNYRKMAVHSKGPTFPEFINYLLEHDSHHMEEAWQSTVRRCTPCHIPYNMVVHYETLWYDVQWLWQRAGLGPLNTTDYVVHHLTPEIRRQYFSDLTISQILGLYKKYKLDFQLFGYTLEEHMAYAKPGDQPLDPVLMDQLPRTNQDRLQKLLEEAERNPMAKKLEESKEEGVKSPSVLMSPSGGLTGERALPPVLSNDIDQVQDYRHPPPNENMPQ